MHLDNSLETNTKDCGSWVVVCSLLYLYVLGIEKCVRICSVRLAAHGVLIGSFGSESVFAVIRVPSEPPQSQVMPGRVPAGLKTRIYTDFFNR